MLAATYYDGSSTRRHPVGLEVRDGHLLIDGNGVQRRIPVGEVDFGEAVEGAPRSISLPGGGCCEVHDNAALSHLLATAGIGESLVVRIQRRWHWALGAFIVVVASAAAAYLWGLPALAQQLAPHVPPLVARTLSDAALAQLDRGVLRPSRLPPARQEEIRRQAAALLTPQQTPPWRLHFRQAPRLGPNALALPGGDIIILDQLVELLGDERQIQAVVAHEVGHLAHHHAMRRLIQDATLSLVLAAWFGDVSSAAVATSGKLLQSGYSREAEIEADAYAASRMALRYGTVEPIVEVLKKLDKHAPAPGNSLFASHPDAATRIAAVRRLQQ
ncbi:M48 family metallopeptidase [Azospira restricta]|uniref:M48 family metallopeptidase n=1 Tax=Azospira restricta TaxID=404405 RepID=A0A974SNQ6_9RHOO|nr:M48 family metallopeptidase [Azospira restricta]QRJ63662.1 M48 family metallopeptidase [Azospira restricta]